MPFRPLASLMGTAVTSLPEIADQAEERGSPGGARWLRWRDRAVPLLVITAILLVLLHGIRRGEFSYNVDETQHACTGQFVADLIRDHPLRHPVAYTYLYYVHYPALSGVLHWPPLFYVWEGLVFLLFGSSVVTARLAVLALAAVALWFWFRMLERLQSRTAAVAGTVLLAFCPSFLLFERTVMLEIPTVALCLAATFCWVQFLRNGRDKDLLWFASLAAAAMLTKQNAVYLPVFCVMTLTVLRQWKLLWRRASLGALALAVAIAGPFYGLVSMLHWSSIQGDLAEKHSSVWAQLAFYPRVLPALLGWPLLAMSLVGLLTCWLWDRRENTTLFLCWGLSVYVAMTAIGHKEPRYVLYLVPAVLYFSLWPLSMRGSWPRIAGMAAIGLLLVSSAVHAWRSERPYVTGYADAARGLAKISDGGVILVDTKIPANLIFFVRNEDPARRYVLLRKALYSVRIKEELGGEEYVHTPADLKQLLIQDGIRFLIVSNRPPEPFPVAGVLRQMLRTPQFRLVKSFPVEGNSPEWANYSLELYENLDAGPPTSPYLRTPMMTLDHDIETPFSELGIPLTPAVTQPPPVR